MKAKDIKIGDFYKIKNGNEKYKGLIVKVSSINIENDIFGVLSVVDNSLLFVESGDIKPYISKDQYQKIRKSITDKMNDIENKIEKYKSLYSNDSNIWYFVDGLNVVNNSLEKMIIESNIWNCGIKN